MHNYLSAFKPTLGKTIFSIVIAIVGAALSGIFSFVGGLTLLPFDLGVSSVQSATSGDIGPIEESLEKPINSAVSGVFSGFFKTFLWVYGIWSGVQLIGIIRGNNPNNKQKKN